MVAWLGFVGAVCIVVPLIHWAELSFFKLCRRLSPSCLLDIIMFAYFETYWEEEALMSAEKPDASAGVMNARDVRKTHWARTGTPSQCSTGVSAMIIASTSIAGIHWDDQRAWRERTHWRRRSISHPMCKPAHTGCERAQLHICFLPAGARGLRGHCPRCSIMRARGECRVYESLGDWISCEYWFAYCFSPVLLLWSKTRT